MKNQQITENNRDKYVKLQADYKKTLGKLKKTPTNPSLLAQRDILLKKMEDAEFLEGIESLDKLRALPDGTDTFRDAIALHSKNHSVVLFIHELLAEKNRLSPEQQRQFAIHNITPFAFPYEAEFVKSYTQNPPKAFPKHFPLVITNIFNNTKRQLEINGLPRQGARWCSNMYKIDASNYFYKQFDLNGITEKVGMTRYQSIRRFSKQPAITLSILSLDIQNTYQDGTKDNPPNLPPPSERDAEGNHIFYRSQYSPAKQQWKIQKVTPSPFKVYQAQPIFDVNLSQELEIMGSYNFKSSPAINGVHLEGCMMCPYAHAEEFHLLKTSLPEGYNQACAW